MPVTYAFIIVEDDLDIRQLLGMLVERDARLGLADSFDNAGDALAAVRAVRPDAILCDVGLPGMSGLDAIPHFRAACPDTVLVMYTADPEGAREAVRLGADAVVGKDVRPQRLFELVVELLERRAFA